MNSDSYRFDSNSKRTNNKFVYFHSLFHSPVVYFLAKTPSAQFVAPPCPNSTHVGIHCNISNLPCDIFKPCQNNASCVNTNDNYSCICSPSFNGTECQFDHRPCQPFRCWNNDQYFPLLNSREQFSSSI